jgi:RNA polymerase sigma factor (sigma-70 family)
MNARATVRLYHLTDEDLMEKFQSGAVEAFEILVSRYKDRLHNFLYRYTNNHQDCEDLVQETFLRVHRSRQSYERIAKFSTWMYTIALNLARTLYRKNQRMQTVTIHESPDDPDSREMVFTDEKRLPDEVTHQNFCMEKLEEALSSLNEEYREAVILRDIQQLSYEEISEITDLPIGTVKSRINRGRKRIQERLEHII